MTAVSGGRRPIELKRHHAAADLTATSALARQPCGAETRRCPNQLEHGYTRTEFWSHRALEAVVSGCATALDYAVVLALALFAAARRSYGLAWGWLIALIVASVATIEIEGEIVVVFILAVWALQRDPGRRLSLMICCLAGAFAGVEVLINESAGLTICAMLVILVLALPVARELTLPQQSHPLSLPSWPGGSPPVSHSMRFLPGCTTSER